MQCPMEYDLGATRVRYVADEKEGFPCLRLLPRARLEDAVAHAPPTGARHTVPFDSGDPMVHLKLTGSPYPFAFSQGRTLRRADDATALRLTAQRVEKTGGDTVIVSELTHPAGHRVTHRLAGRAAHPDALEIVTSFTNGTDRPVRLELLTSFALDGITPFVPDLAPGRLWAHRLRSAWSSEAQLESAPVEAWQLEPSWQGTCPRVERYGQVGTQPVRGFHPWIAAEDRAAGVIWGATLEWGGSWQMQFNRRGDYLALDGGLADREFGHWLKTVAPGETFTAPRAWVACVAGGVDELCDVLRAPAEAAVAAHTPPVELDLPIVFNEWCTSWGAPSHDRMVKLADRLRGTPVRYLVMDAGWYTDSACPDWFRAHGDWRPNPGLYPRGLRATVEEIRARGLIPGIWFEWENVGIKSHAVAEFSERLLRRDGEPLQSGHRRFWDLRRPDTQAFLRERMFDFLRDYGFGYLKTDYNDTVGIGMDDPESPGEGLRQLAAASYALFEKLHAEQPDLVIENCASGGHRLEPGYMARTAMSSFSDAHEEPEIPVIAADLLRVVPARQLQIWAVLRAADTPERLRYTLAATFLGRMCLSGDVDELAADAWALTLDAMHFYRAAWPALAGGRARKYGPEQVSRRRLRGGQTVVRASADGQSALVVAHAFADPGELRAPLPSGAWRPARTFGPADATVAAGEFRWRPAAPWDARALLLSRA